MLWSGLHNTGTKVLRGKGQNPKTVATQAASAEYPGFLCLAD